MEKLLEEINNFYRSYLNNYVPNLEESIKNQKDIINNKQNKVIDVEYAKDKLDKLEKELIGVKEYGNGIFATRDMLLNHISDMKK